MQALFRISFLENPIIPSVHLSCVIFSYKSPQIYSFDFSLVSLWHTLWDLAFINTFEFIDNAKLWEFPLYPFLIGYKLLNLRIHILYLMIVRVDLNYSYWHEIQCQELLLLDLQYRVNISGSYRLSLGSHREDISLVYARLQVGESYFQYYTHAQVVWYKA